MGTWLGTSDGDKDLRNDWQKTTRTRPQTKRPHDRLTASMCADVDILGEVYLVTRICMNRAYSLRGMCADVDILGRGVSRNSYYHEPRLLTARYVCRCRHPREQRILLSC